MAALNLMLTSSLITFGFFDVSHPLFYFYFSCLINSPITIMTTKANSLLQWRLLWIKFMTWVKKICSPVLIILFKNFYLTFHNLISSNTCKNVLVVLPTLILYCLISVVWLILSFKKYTPDCGTVLKWYSFYFWRKIM